jgi:hypothetical protein
MTMLRCVGGPKDGHWIDVLHGQHVSIPLERASKHDVGPAEAHHLVTAPARLATLYTRRRIRTPNGAVEFLAPAGMTDFEALLGLVTHYCPRGSPVRELRVETARAIAASAFEGS